MNKQEVPVWGFEEEETRDWPPDLEPVPVPHPPGEGPVVVHGRAARRFREEAERHRRADGRLPEAVLYLPRGSEAPPEAWAYFDTTVAEGDWDALREILACPRRFEMVEMADELPASFLQELDRPVEDVPVADLPLPAQVREHLATCTACREAFHEAVWDRLWLRHQLLCPDVDRLAAYARGTPDPQVAEHLKVCRACQAQVAVLRRVLTPRREWVTIPLPAVAGEVLDRVVATAREQATALAEQGEEIVRGVAEGLARLVDGAGQAGLVPAGTWTRARGVSGSLQQGEITSLLAHAARGNPVLLFGPRQDLTLGWDREREAVWLGHLHAAGREAVPTFRVELRRGEEVLWSGESEAERVAIPLVAFTRALEAGADRVVIWAEAPQ